MMQMQGLPEAGGGPFQEHAEQLGPYHSWTITEMKDKVDWLRKDISRLKEEEARVTAEANAQEGSMMRAIIIWEIFNRCTQGGMQGHSDITNKLVFELGILEEVHKLLLRKKNLFHGKNIENLHEDARRKLLELVKQALFRIQRQKLKVQFGYHPYLQYNTNHKIPFLSATNRIEQSSHNVQQKLWPFMPSIFSNFDQLQAAGQPSAENECVPNVCYQITEAYRPSGPLTEGNLFYSMNSSEAQSSEYDYMFQSSEVVPHYYKGCNLEGGDVINLQASNWVNTMPVGDTITPYMPMNVNEAASTGTFSLHAPPMVPETIAKQYPINSIIPTVMNQTPNEEVTAPVKVRKARKNEKVDRKEKKGKARKRPEGGYKMEAACSPQSTQHPHESSGLSVPATRPFGDSYGSPQIKKFQQQASGIYSQNPPLQVHPQYYATENMPLHFLTQAPALVQVPSYGLPTGRTCNPGFQQVLYSYPDISKEEHHEEGGSRTVLSSKINKKKKHKGNSAKKAILSLAELNSQDVPRKQVQQLSGVGGLSDGVANPAQIDVDEKKSEKVKNKGTKGKGKGMDTNNPRAEQKPRKKNKITAGNPKEIGENSSTAQTKRSTCTLIVMIFQACDRSLQACQCKQADNWLRNVAPALWLQVIKGAACKMTHCCTLALRMVFWGGAVKKVFPLLLHLARSILSLLCQLLRRILDLLQNLASSFFQFGVRICRCMCACSDKLIPNLTACVSAPIRAILKCGFAIITAPCRLLCSKKTGSKRRRR